MNNRSSFEKILNEKGILLYTNQGKSMLPFIKERKDILVVCAVTCEIKKYDIILSKRPSGRYILHRVVNVSENGTYTICGDNSYKCDYGVMQEQIIGILIGIIRNGTRNNLNGIRYLIFVHLWCRLFFIRKPILKIVHFLKSRINALS